MKNEQLRSNLYFIFLIVLWPVAGHSQGRPSEIMQELGRIEKLFEQGMQDCSQAFGVSKHRVEAIAKRYAKNLKTAIQRVEGDRVNKWINEGKDQPEALALALANQVLDFLHNHFSKEEMNLIGFFYVSKLDTVILTHYYGTGDLSETEVMILIGINDGIRSEFKLSGDASYQEPPFFCIDGGGQRVASVRKLMNIEINGAREDAAGRQFAHVDRRTRINDREVDVCRAGFGSARLFPFGGRQPRRR